MADYRAPIDDIRFALSAVADFDEVARLPGYEEATEDLVEAILTEAGKVASEVLSPINQIGDQEGCRLENGVVRTPTGSVEAYKTFVEGGWNALAFDPEFGGQGLPWTLALAVQEMWQAANMAFSLCPLLTQGAVELLQTHGTDEQKALYLPKLVSGEWSGTMNLTEPQAGSDVGALRTKAVPDGEHYRITGQKIFITHGEHDMTENIVHMVLARTPGAPEGTKGISLFLVPKFLVNADGSLGPRNDLRCASIEHKLGINASPTTVMAYGDDGGALGSLIGQEGGGIACMFTMMNNARITVGVQGLGIAERAYQQALSYARERVQGAEIGGNGAAGRATIIAHPDVRRTLMTMKAQVAVARALCYRAGAALDAAKRQPDETLRAKAQATADLLTPVVKACASDIGCEVASLGVQIHGGMGFIEETGAAQHYRDARILPIYEGTNGIQGLDLVMRKLVRDGGAAATAFIAELRGELETIDGPLAETARDLNAGLAMLEQAGAWLIDAAKSDRRVAAAGASPYLRLFGTVVGGVLLAKAGATAARQLDGDGNANGYNPGFLEARLTTARFYATNLLPQAAAHAAAVTAGADSTLALDEAYF